MFKGRRVILKWGMDIRHGGMPGIACIREKAQIRQSKPFDHFTFFAKNGFIRFSLNRRMCEHEAEQHQTGNNER